MKVSGNILKMKSTLTNPVEYSLPLGDELVPMNDLIGKNIKMTFGGVINCLSTGKKIKKSYGQGFSFEAFMKLACCDMCILKPEQCHHSKGTCREPEWGEKNCFVPHIVYLSVSSHLKVGITRETQVPTRWIDQGATFALPIMKVHDRKTSGMIEIEISKIMSDKTNWRKMLKNEVDEVDLYAVREQIYEEFDFLMDEYDAEDLDEEIVEINFPVLEYPTKVTSIGFDKKPEIEGKLLGIKGQYLILDIGVINMRKHQGYYIELSY